MYFILVIQAGSVDDDDDDDEDEDDDDDNDVQRKKFSRVTLSGIPNPTLPLSLTYMYVPNQTIHLVSASKQSLSRAAQWGIVLADSNKKKRHGYWKVGLY